MFELSDQTTINFTKTRQSTETVSGWVVMIRKPHHSWQEMRNGKQGNETATLGCYDTSVELYIIQDNRVHVHVVQSSSSI